MALGQKLLSYHEIRLEIVSAERVVSAKTTGQRAISSLMGLIMSTSGCLHTVLFRPMARFHLPLASEEEALAQYFRHKQGDAADWDLEGLTRIYKDTHMVNLAMAECLRAVSTYDSSVNALIVLDVFAQSFPYAIEESLEEIRYLFKSFLK